MKKNTFIISLSFLFIVALVGTYLRASPFLDSGLKYHNLVHTHSHVAFQGWVYTVMFLLLTHTFLSKKEIKKGKYVLQFNLTVGVVLGILIAFSLQGYGLYSIAFSTVFQFLNYWFIFLFLKQINSKITKNPSLVSLRFIRTGLSLGFVSTFMPFAIGIASSKGLGGSEIYNTLIYTFMHLQYNGWFLFVALGLFYKLLEDNNKPINLKSALFFYWLFTLSVLPAISHSLLGMSFSNYLLIPAYLSAFMQLCGVVFFLHSIKVSFIYFIGERPFWLKLIFTIFLLSFLFKEVLQSMSVVPFLATFTFSNKPILLAYLHLSLIGVITFLFLGFLFEKNYLTLNNKRKTACLFLCLGFGLTELILVTSGLGIYSNQLFLIAGSALMTVGILLLAISKKKK